MGIAATLRRWSRYPITPIVAMLIFDFGWVIATIAVSMRDALAGGAMFWIGVVTIPVVTIAAFFVNARLRELPAPEAR